MPPVDTSAALVAFQAQSGALKNLVKVRPSRDN